jgi:oligogalacturonide lyase
MRKLIFLALGATRMVSGQTALPAEWTDASTGHRVIRLSRENGTQSLYFNQNAYTADGK